MISSNNTTHSLEQTSHWQMHTRAVINDITARTSDRNIHIDSNSQKQPEHM